jgi:hypothetical protein
MYHYGMVILVLCLTASVNDGHCQSDLPAAERVAKEYMTAFFRGDFEKTAKFTHPDTLATLKQTFLIKLDQARAEGRQDELLKEIGVKVNATTLRRMNPHDFYITIVRSNQKRGNRDALKTMDKTRVEIVSSELINANQAAVRLRIKIPTDDGFDSRASGLLLSRYKKYWRVKTNLE